MQEGRLPGFLGLFPLYGGGPFERLLPAAFVVLLGLFAALRAAEPVVWDNWRQGGRMAMATALSGELLAAVQGLDRAAKLRLVELLAHELALEEEDGRLAAGARYEVWSPYDAAGAADALTKLLAEDERAHGASGAGPTA